MNERNAFRLKAQFCRKDLIGFSHIMLISALALTAGNPAHANGGGKERATPAKTTSYKQVGKASWYGPKFHGKRTASGQVFNQHALTAAHRRLPLGSQAKVTNLVNGRNIVVRITDRGPYKGDRVIDLSRAAASSLAMENSGVAHVRIEAIH